MMSRSSALMTSWDTKTVRLSLVIGELSSSITSSFFVSAGFSAGSPEGSSTGSSAGCPRSSLPERLRSRSRSFFLSPRSLWLAERDRQEDLGDPEGLLTLPLPRLPPPLPALRDLDRLRPGGRLLDSDGLRLVRPPPRRSRCRDRLRLRLRLRLLDRTDLPREGDRPRLGERPE